MIRSMTGYGRGEFTANERKFSVEIKSVNHKFNDISIKLPRFLNQWEEKIRKRLTKVILRGKTDVYIAFETFSKQDVEVKVNEALAAAYVERMRELGDKFNISSPDELGMLVRFADVLSVEKAQQEDETYIEALNYATDEALEHFLAMREAEGIALKADILEKAANIKQLINAANERSPLVTLEYKKKLEARLSELLSGNEIDPQRLAAEVAIFADRSCIDEEITRLYSHIDQLYTILDTGGLVGRKLDFLVQEMNREANTIASKANDLLVTKTAIELKSEIEKMREQIQNIE